MRALINDVSTDLDDPPALAGRDAFPPGNAKVVRDKHPELGPLTLEAAPDDVYSVASELAGAQSRWKVSVADADARTVQGVATSKFFRFRDDFIIRVRPDGKGSRVDMRSASRIGRDDFGANARRIREFFAELAARL